MVINVTEGSSEPVHREDQRHCLSSGGKVHDDARIWC